MLRQGQARLLRGLAGGARGWEQLPAAASAALHHASGGAPAAAAAAAAEPVPASQRHSGGGSWQLAFAALLGLAGSAAAGQAEEAHPPPPDADKGFSLMSLNQRRRLFFKYEKRIRELSPPEKVFEYFASQRDGKVFSMTAGDMMRSVVPVFPPEGSEVVRAGSLPGEPSPKVANEEASAFIRQFDTDGDDRINFDEYLLFQTLLSIPLTDVEVAFRIIDRDGSGAVCRDEFAQLLDALHSQAQRPSVSLRKSAATTESDLHGLMVVFFGKDGRKSLSLAAFRQFICDLREELLRLEFDYYDWKHQGSISGSDFAHSVVSCARLKHVDQYLDKVEAMPSELAAQRVSYADFKQFRDMWRQLHLLSVALEFQLNTSGRVGRQELAWTVQHVMGIKLAPNMVDILFFLFADQGGDKLNVNYMYEVMNRHYTTGLNVAYRFNKPPAAKTYFDCLRECKAKTGA